MRIPKPFYRKQTQTYYLKLHRKWIDLGKNEEEAFRQYHRIMAGQEGPQPDIRVPVLLDRFLDWCQQNRATRTYEWHQKYLQSFKDFIGNIRVAEVKPLHVTAWKATLTTEGNRHCGVRAVKRAFKWGADEGYFVRSPIAACKIPTLSPRDAYLEPHHWQHFISLVKPGPFRDACMFLRLTGCRPQELCIEARHLVDNCIVLDRVKSKGKSHKRVIPLTKRALALVQSLIEKYPSGPIFRTTNGKPWNRSSLNSRFDYFEAKMNAAIEDEKKKIHLFPYILRHSFITDALANGVDPVKLAVICDHKNLKMIMETYQHLEKKRDSLRQALELSECASNPDHPHAA